MKIFNKIFLLFALLPTLLRAQTEVSSTNGIKWSIISHWYNAGMLNISANCSSGSPNTDGTQTGILKADENSIIGNVQLNASKYGVIRLNKDLSQQWLTNIDGFPIAIGYFNNQVFVIAATELSSFKSINNTYLGYLIDPKNGSVITTKQIYKGSDGFYEQPVFLYSPDGSFFKMAIRTSKFARTAHSPLLGLRMNEVAEDYFTTTDFKIIELTGSLDVKSTIKPVLQPGYFLGGVTNKNGDVFLVCDYGQGYIRTARYENGKTAAGKVLQLPISMSDDIMHNLTNNYVLASKKDPMAILFAGCYRNGPGDKELVVAKFNFKDNTVTRNTQVIDKDYLKELSKTYKPFSKKFDDVNLGNKDAMSIRNVVENDGKLVVALSSLVASSGSHSVSISAFDLLVNVYDEKSNLQYQQIIPRSYSSIAETWLGIGMHCRDNVLYLTANNNKGITGFKALYAQIDLKTGSITNITGIEKKDIKNKYPTNPSSTIWFEKQFILSYMEEKGMFNSSTDAHLQLLSY